MDPAGITFESFAAEVLALYHLPLRRVSTFRKMRQVLEEFGRLCGRAADLSPATVAAWIAAHPGRRASTTRTLLSTLRAAAGYGEARGYLTSPFRAWKLHRFIPRTDDEPIERHITTADVARILRRADAEASAGDWPSRRLRVLVYLAAFTGARASEILALRVEDLDLTDGSATIRPNHRRPLKTRSSRRTIPLPGPLRAALAEWLGRADRPSPWLLPHGGLDGPWTSGGPGYKALDQVKALGRRAGVDRVTLLAFRHTFATSADRWQIGTRTLSSHIPGCGIDTPIRRSSAGPPSGSATSPTPLPCPTTRAATRRHPRHDRQIFTHSGRGRRRIADLDGTPLPMLQGQVTLTPYREHITREVVTDQRINNIRLIAPLAHGRRRQPPERVLGQHQRLPLAHQPGASAAFRLTFSAMAGILA